MKLINRKSMLIGSFLLITTLLFSGQSFAQRGQFKALIFSKTQGFRHQSIPNAVKALKDMAKTRVFSVYATEDATIFNDDALKDYDVIIMASTTGDILNDDQKAAFKRFVQSGKGVVGIHSATDTEYNWDWYTKLIGGQFMHHPAQQTARLNVVDSNHPATYHLNEKWLWTDEWYAFKNFNEDVHILIQLDETSYDPGSRDGKSMAMGDVHPMSWYHEYDSGRVFYTALGHVEAAYEDDDFLDHVYGGIWWAAKGYPIQ
ncbi:ThuA domain-containing protein [Echinicola rosea]|nr:ThuA domain-containing protein [Echinicola rosea]